MLTRMLEAFWKAAFSWPLGCKAVDSFFFLSTNYYILSRRETLLPEPQARSKGVSTILFSFPTCGFSRYHIFHLTLRFLVAGWQYARVSENEANIAPLLLLQSVHETTKRMTVELIDTQTVSRLSYNRFVKIYYQFKPIISFQLRSQCCSWLAGAYVLFRCYHYYR
jgi:hypothetical protein